MEALNALEHLARAYQYPVYAEVRRRGFDHHSTLDLTQSFFVRLLSGDFFARTDQDEFGHIFRRNMPYGTVADHGTMFVGFSADQKPLSRMLDSMAGLITGTRDALTRFTQPLTGSYYFVPSVESLRRLR